MISRILGSFFEFPGILITVLLILYFLKRKKVYLIITFIVYIISIEAVYIPLQRIWAVSDVPIDGDTIILGGGALIANGKGVLSEQTLYRVYRGYIIWKEHGGRVFVCGGRTSSGVVEAKLMKDVLISLGVPENSIEIEDESKNTYENLRNIKEKIVGRVNMITSALHTRRAKAVAKALGIDARVIPADYIIDEKLSFMSFLPRYSALEFLGNFTHELIGLVYYHVSGRAR